MVAVPPVELRPVPSSSFGELLTLQRAAYVTEAQLYDDVRLPALVQSFVELSAELAGARCVGAWSGTRLVGAVRAHEDGEVLRIGRLVVAPDRQGEGIGSDLLAAVERDTALPRATLFTGALSAANLRLYARHGYAETSREELRPGLQIVHLGKDLRPSGRADHVGEFLVTARSFAEYRAMFGLTDDDLAGRVLDCPGGAASFTAEACARGGSATAVDPAYAGDPQELTARLSGELARGSAWLAARADRYVWTHFSSPAAHDAERAEAARQFATDRELHPERYLAAALPSLPFPDRAFDLVLSSHLLFTYADRLDVAAHLAALRELVRVCRGEVRIYPLVHQSGRAEPELLAQAVAALADDGLRAVVRPVEYEFQRGARSMLVIEQGSAGPPGRRGPA